jgi:hypothetical protein
MQQKQALIIINALPADALQSIGMSERLIRHAKSAGTFAGGWYRPIQELCENHGVACPLDAFNWKSSAIKLGKSEKVPQGNARGTPREKSVKAKGERKQ